MAAKYDGTFEELRSALERLEANGHREGVASIAERFPHKVRFVEASTDQTTCLPYILKLAGDKIYDCVAKNLLPHPSHGLSQGIFAGKHFAEWLLRTKRLQELEDAREGALVFYFNDAGWKHAGTVEDRDLTILSKWGTFPVYRHPLFQVPTSYGNEVRFYRSLLNPLGLFRAYARECSRPRAVG